MRTIAIRLAALAAVLIATGAAAPAAPAAILEVDITARHVVAWEEADPNEGEECESWAAGSGTQRTTVRTVKPLRLELERVLGDLLLSGDREGTYAAETARRGTWKAHVASMFAASCGPCGPLSEFGECEPEPKQPTFSFQCGTKQIKGRNWAGLGYQRATAVPNLLKGLTVGAGVASTSPFEDCPPTIDGEGDVVTKAPITADLPRSFSRDIVDLRVGQAITAKVSAERATPGKEGAPCTAAKKVADGYSECALTTYEVKVRRIS